MLTICRGSKSSVHLDAIRALAAFAVMIGHLRALFFAPFDPARDGALLHRVLYLVTGLGHQAVLVFFVLSGAFVGASVLSKMKDGSWSIGQYLVDRLSRLYPPLVACLILGGALDLVGVTFFTDIDPYRQNASAALLPAAVADSMSAGTFAGNLLFLQTIQVPTFGSNGPLWSLANEWWYYLAFPLLASLFFRGPRLRKVVAGLVAVALLGFIGPEIAMYFPVWLAGVGILLVVPRRALTTGRRLAGTLGGLVLFGAGLLLSRAQRLPNDVVEAAVLGGTFAVLVWFLLLSPRRADGGRIEVFWRGASGFSYTLYLAHLPLLGSLKAIVAPHEMWTMDARSLSAAVLLIAAVVAWALAIATFTEAKRHVYRDLLVRGFQRVLPPGLVAGEAGPHANPARATGSGS